MKRYKLLLLLLVLWAVSYGRGDAEENIHAVAAYCRSPAAPPQLSPECLHNCEQCHRVLGGTVEPLDIYASGDAPICAFCHPDQSAPSEGTWLLNSEGGGNHPASVFYLPEEQPGQFVSVPVGPKLFTDSWGENPRIYCSTCHNSMGGAIALLRISNRGSALCLSCHRK